MTPTPEALLPCPFCGGKKIVHSMIRDGREVICNNCDASCRAFNPEALTKAIDRWNTRAAPVAPGENSLAKAYTRIAVLCERIQALETALREAWAMVLLAIENEAIPVDPVKYLPLRDRIDALLGSKP